MIRVSDIRNKYDSIKNSLAKRSGFDIAILKDVLKVDELKKEAKQKMENLQAKSNILAKEIGNLFKQGNKTEATRKKNEAVILREEVKYLQEEVSVLEEKLTSILVQIPNVPNKLVPKGNSENDNEVIKENLFKIELPKAPQAHWDLAKKFQIIDFELGNKITGAGFPVYKGKGAKLQRALINFFLQKNIDAGYTEYSPPYLVNEHSGFGTGQLPDKEGQMYQVQSDNLYLIPTAEVPITNMFRNSLIKEEDLPIKCTAYSPCFRREAGSYGTNVRGLNRLHQFDKVEIVQVQHPLNSYNALNEMVTHVESILIDLELPYRILRLCSGDLGFTSSLTYDFEVYSAVQKKWLEVSSVSNFESYQSNRLKLRFKDINSTQLCHTLNGSALALPRIMAALLENNQSEDGIKLPKVLNSYTDFEWIN